MKTKISILGCGWLGLAFGAYLVQKGYDVKGSSTSPGKISSLAASGIKPYLLELTDQELHTQHPDDFFDAAVLIINFPPARRPDIAEYYPAQFNVLLKALQKSKVTKVLFVSSTSVYPDTNGLVFEDEKLQPDKESGKALLRVEALLRSSGTFASTILRFGGLIGYDRQPGNFLAGKKAVDNGDVPVNLIHRDDCVELMYQLIAQNAWGEVFNACCDHHPTRRHFYHEAARAIGVDPPDFVTNGKRSYKIVNSDKIKRALHYSFKYPDPLDAVKLGTSST